MTPRSRDAERSAGEPTSAPLRVAATRGSGFLPSKHGFPFANCFECGTPVISIGGFGIGDISRGLCGGMVYLALDYYFHHQAVPRELSDDVLRQLRHRLLQSFDFPFGYFRYYESQWRSDRSVSIAGVRIVDGLARRTLEVEWPKVKAVLDAGSPVPLGLVHVKTFSLNPWHLGLNHQVLAYGYDQLSPTGDVSIRIYDPNYPGDDAVTLTLSSGDEPAVVHSGEGAKVRGFFPTEYRKADLW